MITASAALDADDPAALLTHVREVRGPLRYRCDSFHDRVVLKHLRIVGEGDVGLLVEYPESPSVDTPTVDLEDVVVDGHFERSYRLVNCWNGRARNCYAIGNRHEMDTKTLRDRPTTKVGFDVQGSMDFHFTDCCARSVGQGYYLHDTIEGGEGEGLHIRGGWIMHAYESIRLKGGKSGGRPTPWAEITGVHFAYAGSALSVTRFNGVKFHHNNLYATEFAANPVGCYVADGCENIHLTDNDYWNNVVGQWVIAVVVDRSKVVIRGGGVDRLPVALVTTPGTPKPKIGDWDIGDAKIFT